MARLETCVLALGVPLKTGARSFRYVNRRGLTEPNRRPHAIAIDWNLTVRVPIIPAVFRAVHVVRTLVNWPCIYAPGNLSHGQRNWACLVFLRPYVSRLGIQNRICR